MHIMFFTERAYHAVPEDEVFKIRSFFGVPNKFFDAPTGAKLLNEYIDEKILCEELGFDGLMLNEHHGTPFCMGCGDGRRGGGAGACDQAREDRAARQSVADGSESAADGRRTRDDRLDLGRTAGARMGARRGQRAARQQRQSRATTANISTRLMTSSSRRGPSPVRSARKASISIIRFVNPWVLPLQKPHPPIWIPGLISPETVKWCAEHRYPYVALATLLEPDPRAVEHVRQARALSGYQAGPENFGYLQPVFVRRY